MSSLFLYGTLRDAELLEIVLGCPVAALNRVEAVLDGHAVDWAAGQIFPTIRVDAQRHAQGHLLRDLSDEQVARLDFYEGKFGYALKPVSVTADGIRHDALVYFPVTDRWPPGARWSLADWQADWGPLSRLAARETMGYFGQLTPEEVARRTPMIRARAASRLAAQAGVPSDVRSDTGAGRVEVIAHESPHAGFFLTDAYDLRHPTFDGGFSAQLRREVFVATDAALVLPYDPVRDRVLMVEQFRMGPFGRGDPRPWMLEPVAGRVDPGETPEEAARREAREEAGLDLRGLEKISSHYCSPGCSTEYFHCFIGICDLPDGHRGPGGVASEHEDIRIHLLEFDAAMRLLQTGEADNGPLVLSLIWLAQMRDRLRASG